MKFKDFLNESTGDVVADAVNSIKDILAKDKNEVTLIGKNKIEVESKYDGELYHVYVDHFKVELKERNEVLETYSMVTNTGKEIANRIIDKLKSYS